MKIKGKVRKVLRFNVVSLKVIIKQILMVESIQKSNIFHRQTFPRLKSKNLC